MRTLGSLLATLGVLLVAGRADADVTVSGNVLIQTGTTHETWTGPTLVQTGATPRTVSGNLTITTEANGSACASAVECTSGICTSGVCCTSVCDQGCGSCTLAGLVGTCSPLAQGTNCRSSQGPCDVADNCNGSSLVCTNNFLANGTVCRSSAGPCDIADRCSGSSATCPDAVITNTVVCNSTGATCNGSATSCAGSNNTGYQVGVCL